jgi:hypothetical protein
MPMPRFSKLLLAGLAAALLCSAIASSALARNFSQNEQRLKITYSPLSFVPSFGSTTRCGITLESSLHSRTYAKVNESLVGYIFNAVNGVCESGAIRANTETLPWHITYNGFTGTLPNITGLNRNVHNSSYEINGEIFGLRVRCRYNIAVKRYIRTVTRGVMSAERAGTEADRSATEGCPSIQMEGTGTVKTPGGGSAVVTLI